MIKKVIPLAFLLIPLTSLTSCNNKESKYPTKKDNPFTITCTQGPMTLYLVSGGESGVMSTDTLNLMWSKDMKKWEEKEITPALGKSESICWSIDLIEGESVYLAGDNPLGFSQTIYNDIKEEIGYIAYRFTDIKPYIPPKSMTNRNVDESSRFTASGNIMSLIKPKKFKNLELAETAIFTNLFMCSNIENAEELILPSKLTNGCFVNMFNGCKSLTKSPVLPCTELTDYCYNNMFNDCELLTGTIDLPASDLKEGCYSKMFDGCTCLSHIRVGFGKDNIWPEEPKTEYDDIPTFDWLDRVSETGTFEWAGDAEAEITHDESHVPSGWEIRHADL